MTTELTVLAWGCLLALVHIFAAAQVKTRQYGTKWNMGARDEDLPPPNALVGRLTRAQDNFFETFPIAIAAILIVQLAHLNNRWTAFGAVVWLAARALYLPLYALGVPVVRTLVFMVSLAGLIVLLYPALT
ncbi:MAG: MAPEG family protein [Sphingomicrobium sp.]